LLARINEIVKSTEEAIRNPDDANLQWTIQELKDVIRDEAGSSGSLNRATGVWLGFRPGVKAEMSKTEAVEDVVNALYIAERKIQAMMQDGQRGNLSSVKKDIDYLRGVSAAIKQRIEKFESTGFSRSGVKAKMAASDIIVKKDAQYIYY
jgi:hypothetical protein